MSLSALGARLLLDVPSRDRLSVLIFHRVTPQPDEMLPDEPDAARFEALMAWVAAVFNVLPLPEAVERLQAGGLPRRALSITFDDGYANNATVAAPILKRAGLHATFFVATGYLDGGRMFNDTVIEAVRGARGDALDLSALGLGRHPIGSTAARRAAVDALLSAMKYRADSERADLAERIAEVAGVIPPGDLMMTSAQAAQLAADGFELGGHTVNHPILAQLDDAAAREEIALGRARLQEISGRPVRLFAYPNGRPQRDYGPRTRQIVRELGFAGAVSTSPGAARVGSDPWQIPRFTPWARSPQRFALQMTRNLRRCQPTYVSSDGAMSGR
jgi:peptidoglycan/xylan/chitin deacetylase (PgdA/CDA1 family)